MRNRSSPSQAEALRQTMLQIIREAGATGITAAAVRAETPRRIPGTASSAISHALRSLQRLGAIRGSGETQRRTYVAALLPSATAEERQQAAADVYKFRPLTSWPPKFRPRPDPDWMHQERPQ